MCVLFQTFLSSPIPRLSFSTSHFIIMDAVLSFASISGVNLLKLAHGLRLAANHHALMYHNHRLLPTRAIVSYHNNKATTNTPKASPKCRCCRWSPLPLLHSPERHTFLLISPIKLLLLFYLNRTAQEDDQATQLFRTSCPDKVAKSPWSPQATTR